MATREGEAAKALFVISAGQVIWSRRLALPYEPRVDLLIRVLGFENPSKLPETRTERRAPPAAIYLCRAALALALGRVWKAS